MLKRDPDRLFSYEQVNLVDIERGHYVLWTNPEGAYVWVSAWPAGVPCPMQLPLRPHLTLRNGASWSLEQAEPLSLHPSVNMVNIWHGWVKNGLATEA